MVGHIIEDRTGCYLAGPADQGGHPGAPFPATTLFTPKGLPATIGIGIGVGSIIGGVHDNGIVGYAQLVQFVQQLTTLVVVFHHAIGVQAEYRK